MKLSDYLVERGLTQKDVSELCGVSMAAVSQWESIPEKRFEALKIAPEVELPDDVAYRDWWVRDDRLHWKIDGEVFSYGHGSENDYDYSHAKIEFIRELLKKVGGSGAVIEYMRPIEFPSDFIRDVEKGNICPNVVDMMKPEIEGGRPVPKRVYPFGEQNGQRIKSK